MKQKTNKRGENGITLIALVITIIVMLILVGVTINLAAEGNLFNYARDAKGKTQNAITDERGLANIDLESSITGKEPIVEIHNWQRGTGENRDVITCSHCGKSYTIGQEIPYTPDEVASATTSLENGVRSKFELAQDANLTADQIAEIADDYEITLNANGTQTITQETGLKWVVLGIEDQNGNGTNETLLITTETPTINTLYLYGAAAYNNGPSIMKDICEKLYSSQTYGKARSITVDDVNAVFGYVPTGGFYKNAYGDCEKTNGFNTKLSDLESRWEAIEERGTNTPNSEKSLGEYIVDGYYYGGVMGEEGIDKTKIKEECEVNPLTTNITEREFNLIFGTCEDLEEYTDIFRYWLASRGVGANNHYDRCASFGPGGVEVGLVFSYGSYFCSRGDEHVSSFRCSPRSFSNI